MTTMECDEIQSHLSAYRDGEGSPKRRWRIRGHLRDCERCRRELERLESICELLDDAVAPPPMSDDFTRQVVAQARQQMEGGNDEEHGNDDLRRLAPALRVAVAAAVLVVGVGSGLVAGPPMWTDTAGGDEQPDACLLVDYSSPAPPGSLAEVYGDVDDPRVN